MLLDYFDKVKVFEVKSELNALCQLCFSIQNRWNFNNPTDFNFL